MTLLGIVTFGAVAVTAVFVEPVALGVVGVEVIGGVVIFGAVGSAGTVVVLVVLPLELGTGIVGILGNNGIAL